jgi:hypothetical protein
MMRIEMINLPTFDDVLLRYSGRRLQYAIKLGILPTPERLRRVLSKQAEAKKTMAKRPVSASKIIGMNKLYSQSS